MQTPPTPQPVYFGGSRSIQPRPGLIALMRAILQAGRFSALHVGCQHGADNAAILAAATLPALPLRVFAVAPTLAAAPAHVQFAAQAGAAVTLSAGGTSAPMPARYLLRSRAAFAGCAAAVFFVPGPGSLAVARECVRAGLPVFAFVQDPPAPIPATPGAWVRGSFVGFSCWQFQPAQVGLF